MLAKTIQRLIKVEKFEHRLEWKVKNEEYSQDALKIVRKYYTCFKMQDIEDKQDMFNILSDKCLPYIGHVFDKVTAFFILCEFDCKIDGEFNK